MTHMLNVRSAPSGPLILPVDDVGTVNWDGIAPITLTLMPAGHYPGLYRLVFSQYVRVAAAAGTQTQVISWNQPRFGATTLSIAIAPLTSIVWQGIAYRIIESSGIDPITLTYTAAGLSGTPSVQLIAGAVLDALSPR
jgi:hypothetical protein